MPESNSNQRFGGNPHFPNQPIKPNRPVAPDSPWHPNVPTPITPGAENYVNREVKEDNYVPDNFYNAYDWLLKIASEESEEYGPAKEPLTQYQIGQRNLDLSKRNIGQSYDRSLQELEKASQIQQLKNREEALSANASPFALQQADRMTNQELGESLYGITNNLQDDKSNFDFQKNELAQGLTNAFSNEDWTSKLFKRAQERAFEEANKFGDYKTNIDSKRLMENFSNVFKNIYSKKEPSALERITNKLVNL